MLELIVFLFLFGTTAGALLFVLKRMQLEWRMDSYYETVREAFARSSFIRRRSVPSLVREMRRVVLNSYTEMPSGRSYYAAVTVILMSGEDYQLLRNRLSVDELLSDLAAVIVTGAKENGRSLSPDGTFVAIEASEHVRTGWLPAARQYGIDGYSGPAVGIGSERPAVRSEDVTEIARMNMKTQILGEDEIPKTRLYEHSSNSPARDIGTRLRLSIDGTSRLFEPPLISLGRGEHNNLKVAGKQVSRDHAVLEFSDGRWKVRDHSSSNGTYLNGSKVGAHGQLVASGDVIQCGVNGTKIQLDEVVSR